MNPDKIHSVLLQELGPLRAAGQDVEGDERQLPIIVRLRPRSDVDELGTLDVSRSMVMQQVDRYIPLVSSVAGRATQAEIDALSDSPLVDMIWYDETVYASLDHSVPTIGVPAIWQSGNEGAGIRICIVDTGIDAAHPDFAGRIQASEDFTDEGVGDTHGHGTHVASIAAGSGAASAGLYRGVAPRATILVAKTLRGDGTGRMSFIMAGVEWALDQGAQVINLSLGTRGDSDGTDASSVTCDAAMRAGAVVIVAAGNDGPTKGSVGSPGGAREVITIGAVAYDNTIPDFSSRGPTRDGRPKPDLVLPGVDIVAARASGTGLGRPLTDQYTSVRGTSMAAPHAAGVAALMLEVNPDLTPADVKRLMIEAVKRLDGIDENWQGKGCLLADRAVALAKAARRPAPTPIPESTPTAGNLAEERDGCLGSLARLFGRR